MRDSRAERDARQRLALLEERLTIMEQCVIALTTDVQRKDADLVVAHAALEDMAGCARIAEGHWQIEREALERDRDDMKRDREAMEHDREAMARDQEATEHERDAMNQHRETMERDRQAMETHLSLVEQRAGTAEAWAGVLAGEVERKEADLLVAHSALEKLTRGHAAEPPDESAAHTVTGTAVPGPDQ